MQEKLITNSDVKLHCLFQNWEQNTTPLLVIPGINNSAEEMCEALGRHDIKTVVISLRGRGKSQEAASYSFAEQASDVAAVISDLSLEAFSVFGYSAGASIAARGLVMANAQNSVKAFISGDFPPYYPPYDKSWADAVARENHNTTSEDVLHSIARDAEYIDVLDDYMALNCPKLFIRGGLEGAGIRNEDVAPLTQMLPNTTVTLLAESNHNIFQPDTSMLLDVITKFISQ